MIIYIYGPDTFRSREKLRELISEFKKKRDPHGHNVARLRAPEIGAEQFWDAVSSPGLLSPKRMIVLEGAVTSGSAERQETILSYLQQLHLETPESNAVVFWDAGGENESPAHSARTFSRARAQKSKKSQSQRSCISGCCRSHTCFFILDSRRRMCWYGSHSAPGTMA